MHGLMFAHTQILHRPHECSGNRCSSLLIISTALNLGYILQKLYVKRLKKKKKAIYNPDKPH